MTTTKSPSYLIAVKLEKARLGITRVNKQRGHREATVRHGDDGWPIIDLVTCGSCGRTWNDALITGVTPAPSARCPFEYQHREVAP